MAIGDKLKKAASLFVQFDEPPTVPAGSGEPLNFSQVDAPAGGGMSEIDKKLAEMDAHIAQLKTGDAKTVEEVVRASAGPNLDQIQVAPSSVPPLSAEGALDFGAIFRAANLPSVAFSAEQTLEMLANLPANLPLDVKRQTVHVTLSAMGSAIGATAETIVADASRKLAALASYANAVSAETDATVTLAEAEIAALSKRIEEQRVAILQARERQASVQRLCDTEADRLDDVLEFFSLDIGASKYAPGGATPPPLPRSPS